MIENLTLMTQKQKRRLHFNGKAGDYLTRIVQAIEREDGYRVEASPNFVINNGEPLTPVQLALGTQAAERLVQFYGRSYRDGQAGFDCFSFAINIATGQALEPNCPTFETYEVINRVYPNDLREGIVYGVLDDQANGVHAVIGG